MSDVQDLDIRWTHGIGFDLVADMRTHYVAIDVTVNSPSHLSLSFSLHYLGFDLRSWNWNNILN